MSYLLGVVAAVRNDMLRVGGFSRFQRFSGRSPITWRGYGTA